MKKMRGFTLIELLIVIALLGALAVGLIGAIDPFEQLKKGTDTGIRDLVSQVQTAVIRYYSVKSAFPGWTVTPNKTKLATTTSGTTAVTASLLPALNDIIGAGELRSDFVAVQGAKLDRIYLSLDATTNTLSVCYTPDSKSFQSDPNTKYNPDHSGKPAVDASVVCKSANATDGVSCDWCIQ